MWNIQVQHIKRLEYKAFRMQSTTNKHKGKGHIVQNQKFPKNRGRQYNYIESSQYAK